MTDSYIFSVSEINEYVSTLLSSDPLLRQIEVEGELSGYKKYRSGHCYFSLKDADALIRGVIFKGDAYGLKFEPQDGMHVVVTGRIALYSRDGQYQIYARSIRPVGEGELYKRFLMLKERLDAEGLFAPEHKKPIPFLPKCVGVVTSESGAAYRDIQSVIRRRFPGMPIVLMHSAVQGADAPREIVRAIKQLDALNKADVIIVGRGGGSIEDLWAYNDEGVARAIYECKTPVISAVGHEIDFTIADFVSDMRAPTPSAAAELAVPVFDEVVESLNIAVSELYGITAERLNRESRDILSLGEHGAFFKTRFRLENEDKDIKSLCDGIRRATLDKLSDAEYKAALLESRLKALNPETSLKRGFLLMHDNAGRPITKRSSLLDAHDAIVEFKDGSVPVKVRD